MINYIRVGIGIPDLEIANCDYNKKHIISVIDKAKKNNIDILTFPELSITGYSCEDLFFQSKLISSAINSLEAILDYTKSLEMLIALGMPIHILDKVVNCGILIQNGEILGIVPKTYLSSDNRWFSSANKIEHIKTININKKNIPIGNDLLFSCANIPNLNIALEIGDDSSAIIPPSVDATLNGANLILNLAADYETIGQNSIREDNIKSLSMKTNSTYIYSNAGASESTSEVSYSGESYIYENGNLLNKNHGFVQNKSQLIYSDTDMDVLYTTRRKKKYSSNTSEKLYKVISFSFNNQNNSKITDLERNISSSPFTEHNNTNIYDLCETAFNIQSTGIIKRFTHTNIKNAVIGVSGGLDSTIALIGLVRAFDSIGKCRKNIIGISMPGFGTSQKTYINSLEIMKVLGITVKDISIKEATLHHFKDIEHDKDNHDVTYENTQARERTQILMDIANKENGLVIGTGDLSEIALGWSTYNGDHMSMYSINCGIPKTIIPHLINHYITTNNIDDELKKILIDVIHTPVSPELLPPNEQGEIEQKTEDIVGPYELVDFYLYNIFLYGFSPTKLIYMAHKAFNKKYDIEFLIKYLNEFYRRFFNSQFKRSAMPDGIKIFDIGLSPKNDFKMPSDASYHIWKKELDEFKESFNSK